MQRPLKPHRSSERIRPRGSDATPPRVLAAQREVTTAVKLTRKLADLMDGVDLSAAYVGDRLDLPVHDADMLIAEGWAEPVPVRYHRRAGDLRAQAADRPAAPRRRPRR